MSPIGNASQMKWGSKILPACLIGYYIENVYWLIIAWSGANFIMMHALNGKANLNA